MGGPAAGKGARSASRVVDGPIRDVMVLSRPHRVWSKDGPHKKITPSAGGQGEEYIASSVVSPTGSNSTACSHRGQSTRASACRAVPAHMRTNTDARSPTPMAIATSTRSTKRISKLHSQPAPPSPYSVAVQGEQSYAPLAARPAARPCRWAAMAPSCPLDPVVRKSSPTVRYTPRGRLTLIRRLQPPPLPRLRTPSHAITLRQPLPSPTRAALPNGHAGRTPTHLHARDRREGGVARVRCGPEPVRCSGDPGHPPPPRRRRRVGWPGRAARATSNPVVRTRPLNGAPSGQASSPPRSTTRPPQLPLPPPPHYAHRGSSSEGGTPSVARGAHLQAAGHNPNELGESGRGTANGQGKRGEGGGETDKRPRQAAALPLAAALPRRRATSARPDAPPGITLCVWS